MIPSEIQLRDWTTSQWIEYQAWLFHHSFLTLHQWHALRTQTVTWQTKPFISIITPVFNTDPAYLCACIRSVQFQAYPHWELCIVDDGSDHPATVECLKQFVATEPRLRIQFLPQNCGICHATNQALAMAQGDYVAFLDHDDRLAPEALYHIALTICQSPQADIIYSDRDMLSPEGFRFMHLFKPNWSPETLLSGNYLFHLLAYRRTLLQKLEGVRVGFEGSQDYDLILRATDDPVVQVHHIPKILYHWQQHQQSVAMEHNAKEYAYHAGVHALQETLTRRNLQGEVIENDHLWRGHYRVRLHSFPATSYHLLRLNTLENYAQQVNRAMAATSTDFLIILGTEVQPLGKETYTELISWFQIAAVGVVTGKVVDMQGRLLHAGLVHRPNGIPLAVYAKFPENTPGYMATTAIVHNVSAPHPSCCVLRRTLWQELGGLDDTYQGMHSLLDCALKTLKKGQRIVYTPFARFMATNLPETWSEPDRLTFIAQWQSWLTQGDPYYSPHLSLKLVDMGLNTDWQLSTHNGL